MPNATCSTVGCDKQARKRGLCEPHYLQARRAGTLPQEWVSRMHSTLADFLLDRIEVDASGCWTWTGRCWPNGYGLIGGKPHRQAGTTMAHRAVYEMHVGTIPDGLVLDHLCRNRICVNPDHLEPVTNAENLRRGEHPKMVAARNGTCVRGHRVEGDNAYVTTDGYSSCRTCMRNKRAERYAAHKAKAGIPDAKKRGICNDPDCTQLHYAKGACKKHYQRAARGSSA